MTRQLLCLFSGLLAMSVDTVYGDPYVVSETYNMSNSNYTFVDVNGELSSILDGFEIEIVVRGLGFGEGPKWIQDCDYINNGYMLLADSALGCIWKYWAIDNDGNYNITCIRELAGELPNGIGWNLNYPDEIFVAVPGANAVVRLNLTDDNLTELNRWEKAPNASESGKDIQLWAVNDIVEDSQGNAYFSNWPGLLSDPSIVAGTWKIPRDTMEVELVEQLNYGTNGIAMTLDETLLVLSNTVDYPSGTYDGSDADQANFTNLYWRGYRNNGSIDGGDNDFNAASAFYYLQTTNAIEYFDSLNAHDGSAFDFENNYWQSLIDGGSSEGYALITNAEKYGNNASAIIGIINFTDTTNGPTNFGKGMDGYMYVTMTNWFEYGSGGVLARLKLQEYLTNEDDGGSSDYVLDCSSYSSSSSSSSTEDPTSAEGSSTTQGPTTTDGPTTPVSGVGDPASIMASVIGSMLIAVSIAMASA